MNSDNKWSDFFQKAKAASADFLNQAEETLDKSKVYASAAAETAKERAEPILKEAEVLAAEALHKISESTKNIEDTITKVAQYVEAQAPTIANKVESFIQEVKAKADQKFEEANEPKANNTESDKNQNHDII